MVTILQISALHVILYCRYNFTLLHTSLFFCFLFFPQPLKALRASAGTSQPVLSIEQVQTVFYQLPELLDLHTEFYNSLRAKLGMYLDLELGLPLQMHHENLDLSVGDLFMKFVSLCFSHPCLCSWPFESAIALHIETLTMNGKLALVILVITGSESKYL